VAQMTRSKEQGGATHLGLSWWSPGLVIGNRGERQAQDLDMFLWVNFAIQIFFKLFVLSIIFSRLIYIGC
jgi:hypothetical protein